MLFDKTCFSNEANHLQCQEHSYDAINTLISMVLVDFKYRGGHMHIEIIILKTAYYFKRKTHGLYIYGIVNSVNKQKLYTWASRERTDKVKMRER